MGGFAFLLDVLLVIFPFLAIIDFSILSGFAFSLFSDLFFPGH
jgi:hypothetical protein